MMRWFLLLASEKINYFCPWCTKFPLASFTCHVFKFNLMSSKKPLLVTTLDVWRRSSNECSPLFRYFDLYSDEIGRKENQKSSTATTTRESERVKILAKLRLPFTVLQAYSISSSAEETKQLCKRHIVQIILNLRETRIHHLSTKSRKQASKHQDWSGFADRLDPHLTSTRGPR